VTPNKVLALTQLSIRVALFTLFVVRGLLRG
jgi:hypothetical protein